MSDNQGVRDNPPPHPAAAEKKANIMANQHLLDEIAALRAVASEVSETVRNIEASAETPGAYSAGEIRTALEPIARNARRALDRRRYMGATS